MSTEHPQQLGASCNIRENSAFFVMSDINHDHDVTDSFVSDQNRSNVLVFFLDSVLCMGIILTKMDIAGVFLLAIESIFYPGLVECEPSVPNLFQNSPIIKTSVSNATYVQSPEITFQHNTTQSKQNRLHCYSADCDMTALSQ